MRRSKGFTLIELLVVIAIIAILAAILFPVFAQARDKGRQATCNSNIRQITMAFMMYINDYDETFMIWNSAISVPGTYWPYWNYAVDPYIKGQMNALERKGIWICPSATKLSNVNMTYGYNHVKLGRLSVTGDPAYLASTGNAATLASLQEPANTVVVTDGLEFARPPYGVLVMGYPDTITAPHTQKGLLGYFAGGSGNIPMYKDPDGFVSVGWADGHAKPIKRRLLTPRGLNRAGDVAGDACSDDLFDRDKPSPWRITGNGC